MKKTFIILITILLCSIAGGLYFVNKHIMPLWEEDVLKVEAISPILQDSIKIEYGFNSINRETDKELFDKRERYTILFDGVEKEKIKTEYGENDFLVTYKGYYFSFRQFKTQNKLVHSYLFRIEELYQHPYLEVSIEGQEGMHFSRPMAKIADADHYRCNTPIDSVGTIYNMIELIN